MCVSECECVCECESGVEDQGLRLTGPGAESGDHYILCIVVIIFIMAGMQQYGMGE